MSINYEYYRIVNETPGEYVVQAKHGTAKFEGTFPTLRDAMGFVDKIRQYTGEKPYFIFEF